MRIVSLLPSATEIVYLLGLGDHLTGVSHECDYPKAALGKRKIITPAFESSGLSGRGGDGTAPRGSAGCRLAHRTDRSRREAGGQRQDPATRSVSGVAGADHGLGPLGPRDGGPGWGTRTPRKGRRAVGTGGVGGGPVI